MLINNRDDQRQRWRVAPAMFWGHETLFAPTCQSSALMLYNVWLDKNLYDVRSNSYRKLKSEMFSNCFSGTKELLWMDVSKYCDYMTRCLENITADVWDFVACVKIQTCCFQTPCDSMSFLCRWKYPPIWTHFVWKVTHGNLFVIFIALSWSK